MLHEPSAMDSAPMVQRAGPQLTGSVVRPIMVARGGDDDQRPRSERAPDRSSRRAFAASVISGDSADADERPECTIEATAMDLTGARRQFLL